MLKTIVSQVETARARARRRRAYSQLLELDDHILHDVGLRREDIRAHLRGGILA